MSTLTLLCIGKLKTPWIAEGCRAYADRLCRSVHIDVRELPPSREKDGARQAEDESGRLLAAMGKLNICIVLDETGERMTSRDFASFLKTLLETGTTAAFVIGGAYGLTEDVRKAAKHVIRLSDMTLPHELCRLVFLEQLYRAVEIGKGSGYHH